MATVEERIKQYNSNRIPEYSAIKYKLMTEDPFRFFRGTCHLFYEDLHKSGNIPASPECWICGDLHLENFGSYKGDNRLVYFDLTDFDEGIRAPAAWELVRMVASILIGLEKPGSTQKGTTAVAKLFLEQYSAILNNGKALYIEQLTARGITRSLLDKVSRRKQKELIGKRTITHGGKLKLRFDNIKLFPVAQTLKQELTDHLNQWIKDNKATLPHYQVSDTGFRIAGTGSIGTRRYLFLLKKANSAKYLLLDMKHATPSSLQPFAGKHQPGWNSDAERVIAIQQRMQNIPPALLCSTIFNNKSYVLKEMQPTEDKIPFTAIRDNHNETGNIIQDLALLTASAHLRSSGRQGAANADELIEFGGSRDWQKAVLEYALDYKAQVRMDHKAYVKAWNSGFFS
ncbi:MAG: DUF2252 family protein [Ferruginibacter sp.]